MLEDFMIDTFSRRIGERFRIRAPGPAVIEVELADATAASAAGSPRVGGDKRLPFSVVFRGPLEPILMQRIYRFEHDALGAFDLFIVPIGPDESGMRYEAVFG
jgi:hypothetical protein